MVGLAQAVAAGDARALTPIIEFVGLPGAGKSTVAACVVAALRARGVACGERAGLGRRSAGRPRHYASLARRAVARPRPLAAVLRYVLESTPRHADRMLDATKLLAWISRLDVAARSGLDVVLLDQGVVQHAWTAALGGEGRAETWLHRALGQIVRGAGAPVHYVHFRVEHPIALARIRERPTMLSYFDRMPPPEAARMLHAYADALPALLQSAIESCGASCYSLDATLPIDVACSEVLTYADSCLVAAGSTRPPLAPADRTG